MADRSRPQLASAHEELAIKLLQADKSHPTQMAQTAATLALCQRVADLTDRVEAVVLDALGDDSHLDRLKKSVDAVTDQLASGSLG